MVKVFLLCESAFAREKRVKDSKGKLTKHRVIRVRCHALKA